jgi:hypothetical protein
MFILLWCILSACNRDFHVDLTHDQRQARRHGGALFHLRDREEHVQSHAWQVSKPRFLHHVVILLQFYHIYAARVQLLRFMLYKQTHKFLFALKHITLFRYIISILSVCITSHHLTLLRITFHCLASSPIFLTQQGRVSHTRQTGSKPLELHLLHHLHLGARQGRWWWARVVCSKMHRCGRVYLVSESAFTVIHLQLPSNRLIITSELMLNDNCTTLSQRFRNAFATLIQH